MNTFLVALFSIGLSVAAQFFLKAGMSSVAVKQLLAAPMSFLTPLKLVLDPKIFAGFFLYALGALVWLSVLARWDVSKAYPLVGLGFVATVAIGFVLGEDVGVIRVLGVVLICSGVLLVARS